MLSLVVACVALIEGANPYLAEGRALYSSVHYAEAETKLRLACAVPTSTPQEVREACDLLARSVAALGRPLEAEQVYAELLERDPEAPEPVEASPKVRALYQRAKARVYPPAYVRLRRLPSVPGRLEIEIIDPWKQVQEIQLSERQDGGFQKRSLRRTAGTAATELSTATDTEDADWVVDALAADGSLLAQLRRTATPRPPSDRVTDVPELSERRAASARTLPPEGASLGSTSLPPEPPAVDESRPEAWPIWVTVGLSAALAGTGALLVVSSQANYRDAEQAAFASQTRAAFARHAEQALVARWMFGGAALAALSGGLLWGMR